ncbi:MAG: hypothetical protein K0R28_201 [Paenibacillus sp.]|nr:hypothetical protein [Paenibacillus sp.]
MPEVDLTGKVMGQIYSLYGEHSIHKQRRKTSRISPIFITACVLLVIAAASVSAAAYFKTTWNGIQVHIGEHALDDTPADKNEPSYKEKLEIALSKSADTWKTISLEDAEKHFSFSLLRPLESKFTLVTSLGVVPQDKDYRVKSAEEWWLGGFYDIFQWNQRDIVVSQNADNEMTESLNNPNKTMSLTFQEAHWENVEVSDDTLAMFTANGNENLLIFKYKTADSKVISMELRGDIAREDMVKLAKAYIGK